MKYDHQKVWISNGRITDPDCMGHLNYRLVLVRYLNGGLNTGLFKDKTTFYHSNTGLAHNSDPLC